MMEGSGGTIKQTGKSIITRFELIWNGSTERNCYSKLKFHEKVRSSYWFRYKQNLGKMGKCNLGIYLIKEGSILHSQHNHKISR